MKKTLLKRSIFLFVAVILISFLVSCTADLGKFSEEGGYQEFLDALDDVVGKYDDNKTVAELSYDVEESITNDTIMEKLEWPDDSDKVEYKEYCYIVIPFKSALKIESIALYVAKERDPDDLNGINVEFSCFYFENESDAPTNIKLLTSDDTRIVEQDDGNGGTVEVEEEIQYDDPPIESSLTGATLYVTDDFNGFILDNFAQAVAVDYIDDGYLLVDDGGLLYIRIENNSGLNKATMKPCKFSFMNLLIRAI